MAFASTASVGTNQNTPSYRYVVIDVTKF